MASASQATAHISSRSPCERFTRARTSVPARRGLHLRGEDAPPPPLSPPFPHLSDRAYSGSSNQAAAPAAAATAAAAPPPPHLVPRVLPILGGKRVQLLLLLPAGPKAVRLGQQLVLTQDEVVVPPALRAQQVQHGRGAGSVETLGSPFRLIACSWLQEAGTKAVAACAVTVCSAFPGCSPAAAAPPPQLGTPWAWGARSACRAGCACAARRTAPRHRGPPPAVGGAGGLERRVWCIGRGAMRVRMHA